MTQKQPEKRKVSGRASQALRRRLVSVKVALDLTTIPLAAAYLHEMALQDQRSDKPLLTDSIDEHADGDWQVTVPYEDYGVTKDYRIKFSLNGSGEFVLHALQHGMMLFDAGYRLDDKKVLIAPEH